METIGVKESINQLLPTYRYSIRQMLDINGLLRKHILEYDRERVGNLTFWCNHYLRTMLVESSCQAIRLDPAMMQYYQQKKVNSAGQ